jgi:hypothetical protein
VVIQSHDFCAQSLYVVLPVYLASRAAMLKKHPFEIVFL